MLFLNVDCLVEIAERIKQDDVLQFSLISKIFYLACKRSHRKLKTRKWSIATSLKKVQYIFQYEFVVLGIKFRRDICEWAAASGKLEIIQWAMENNCNNFNTWTCARAAANGHLDILIWLRSNNCPWDIWTIIYAVVSGHLEVVKWVHNNVHDNVHGEDFWYIPIREGDLCMYAAGKGHLHILKWARQNGYSWNPWSCTYAATDGHLETLKWLRNNNCPWDEWTCVRAADNGHLELFKWAYENGAPLNLDECLDRVDSRDYIEIGKIVSTKF